MAKLKTPGIITPEEYQQASAAGRFLICEDVRCSYCQSGVRRHDQDDLYCHQHRQLRLWMDWYPGFPGIPKEAPRYNEMHFTLSKRVGNQLPFNAPTTKPIAEAKGCPFCSRYMDAVDPLLAEKLDPSLLNQSLSCRDCDVAFRIRLTDAELAGENVLELRFQPEAQYLLASAENVLEMGVQPEETSLLESAVTQTHPDTRPQSVDSDTREADEVEAPPPSVSEAVRSNAHTDIAEQILEYLRSHGELGKTGLMIKAIGCSRQGFKEAIDKLIVERRVRKIVRGVFELIHRR